MTNPLFSHWPFQHRFVLLTVFVMGCFICFAWLYASVNKKHYLLDQHEIVFRDFNGTANGSLFRASTSHSSKKLPLAQPNVIPPIREMTTENASQSEVRADGKLTAQRLGHLLRRRQSRASEEFNGTGSALTMLQSDANPDYTFSGVAAKRRFIRQMMTHAWNGYARYAWGYNRVAPNSRRPSSIGVFGNDTLLGITIVDALDSLWIMGLRDEFARGRQWTVENLNFASVDRDVSVFETNIRVLGGLLSAYSLSGDVVLLQKAHELGRLLLPAFDAPAGIPWALYNFKTKTGKNWGWVPGSGVILSEFGSLHLEFAFLSNATGDPVFLNKVLHVREQLDRLQKPKNLYTNYYINTAYGLFESQQFTTVGSMGDSFYEYLLKVWLWSNRTDTTSKRMYDEAMADQYQQVHEMDHLSCFMGGLYGLNAPYASTANESQHFIQRGAQIADTCHATYTMTRTGLGPDIFRFQPGVAGIQITDSAFYLRPEAVETYFIMWRRTRDPKYRQWGWEVAQAIEKYCRAQAGYAGLRNVNIIDDPLRLNQDDTQDTFFLAETLKYLYLLFVDEKMDGTTTAADDGGVDISLEEYVFSTEAHPLPIYGGSRFPSAMGRPLPTGTSVAV